MDAAWVVEHRTDPRALEAAFRQDSRGFRTALAEALGLLPDDLVLQAWEARLAARSLRPFERKGLLRGFALILGTALVLRLPALWLNAEWFYPRYAPLIVMLGLAIHHGLRTGSRPRWAALLALTVFTGLHVGLLPGEGDSVALALLHVPVAAFAVVGFHIAGSRWRTVEARLEVVRHAGDLLILCSLLALGGGVFSALTIALFELLTPAAPEWYGTNVGVMGAASLPLLATLLQEKLLQGSTGLPTLLVRIFTPLFLAMVGLYLPIALFSGANPFVDRNFLLIVNGLLGVVAAMGILSVAERGRQPWSKQDLLTMSLLGLCLVVDALALSSILFRLASFGLSPNRVAVVGANLLILGHVANLFLAHWRFQRGAVDAASLGRAATRWLPLHALWAACVVFLLPLLFQFR